MLARVPSSRSRIRRCSMCMMAVFSSVFFPVVSLENTEGSDAYTADSSTMSRLSAVGLYLQREVFKGEKLVISKQIAIDN